MVKEKLVRFLAFFAVAALFALPSGAAVEKRVALVIGNSAYQHAVPLPNPERDARAIAAKLRQLGFVVVEGYDLDHAGFNEVIREFAGTVSGADLGLFFYAGHGMQVNGRNFFVPVDAVFKDATALDFEAIPLDLITRQLQNDVAVRLVILDACRDNPLSRSLSRSLAGTSRSTAIQEGLAEVRIGDGGEGTAIIFATSPDEVALDGDGDHSPFTEALLSHIDAPDTPLQVVMSRVTGDVYNSTAQRQRPWINASLTGEVYLNPQGGAVANVNPRPDERSSAGADDPLQREKILYNLAQETGQIEDYEAYLVTFPDGLFAENARRQVERLKKEAEQRLASVDQGPSRVTETEGVARTVTPAFELPVTDVVKAAPANEMTEDSLDLDKAKRAEIQTRLTLAGFDTGRPDGSFGRRTRGAVQGWQASKGLQQTGYLNQPQYELLMIQTETAFAAYVPEKPAVSTERRQSKGTTTQRGSSSGQVVQRRVQRSGPNSEEVGRFVGGVIGGLIRR